MNYIQGNWDDNAREAQCMKRYFGLRRRSAKTRPLIKSLRLSPALVGVFVGLGMSHLSVAATEIWVAPNGSDANPGTRELPLASPALALRHVREIRRTAPAPLAAPIQVLLRGGDYPLVEPLLLRPEDSGTAASPTVVAAAPGEQPRLSGGVPVPGWQLLAAADAPAGLPGTATGRVWVAEVPRFNGRALEFRQLWVGERKAIRGRTPNGDHLIPLGGWSRASREAWLPKETLVPSRVDGVELELLQQWEIAVLRLKSARPDGDHIAVTFEIPESRIEFEHPWPQPVFPPKFRTSPFFLANAIEFLDAPGEWFEDIHAGRIYYWPREDEDLSRARVVAPALETIVDLAGTTDRPVRYVTFSGIGFAHTTWLRPSISGHVPLQAGMYMVDAYGLRPPGTPDWHKLDNQAWLGRPPAAVRVTGVEHVTFNRCRFAHTAANGLDLAYAVHDSDVEGCTFRDIGINGLMAGAFSAPGVEAHLPYNPKDERVLVARVRCANNLLSDCANEDWGGVAVIAGSVRDFAIEHNLIDGTSYTGISLGWGWTRTLNAARHNVVRANRIEHVATRMSDTAGIYTLSAQPDTLIAENVIGEIKMSPWVHDPEHWFYLYTDEGTTSVTVRDNWCPAPRFLKNATGPGNLWENNGPQVSDAIRAAAGLEPAFRALELDMPQQVRTPAGS